MSCLAWCLTSLEEMDIDDKSRGSKRKRDTSGDSDFVVSDGQADNEEQLLLHHKLMLEKNKWPSRWGLSTTPPALCVQDLVGDVRIS